MRLAHAIKWGLWWNRSASNSTKIRVGNYNHPPPHLHPWSAGFVPPWGSGIVFPEAALTTIDLDTKPALSENIRKLEPPGGHKCIIGLHKLCFDEISSLLDFELKISWKIILSQQILKPWLFFRSINSNPFLQKSLICAFNYGSFWDLPILK